MALALPAGRPGASPAAPRSGAARVAQVEDAHLALGGRPVLDGASLSLGPGEIYVLLGPNGAGKTSLLRVLCGRLSLERGSVTIGESRQDPRIHPRARALLGLVPQDIALYPRLTVRENLEVFARLAGAPRTRDAIGHILHIAQLTPLAKALVATLSGGQQRRLNVAVALVAEPKLLLLDEPTVGIDLAARSAVHEILLDLRERGVAILLVTHDFGQAERLADRVGIMNAGRIVLAGRPGEILKGAFGSRKQVEALLADPPDAGAEAALRALGLAPVEGRLLWRGLTGEGGDASQLLSVLQAGPSPLREVRIREPGLDTLFREITGGRER